MISQSEHELERRQIEKERNHLKYFGKYPLLRTTSLGAFNRDTEGNKEKFFRYPTAVSCCVFYWDLKMTYNHKYCTHTEWIICTALSLVILQLLYSCTETTGAMEDKGHWHNHFITPYLDRYWWLKSLQMFYPRNLMSILFILLPAIFSVYSILWFMKKSH